MVKKTAPPPAIRSGGALRNHQSPRDSEPEVVGIIRSKRGLFDAILPGKLDSARFIGLAFAALQDDPKLGRCDPLSVLGGLYTCAKVGMEPNTVSGHAYLIPHKIDGRLQAQFFLGYQGARALVLRQKDIWRIEGTVVRERDTYAHEEHADGTHFAYSKYLGADGAGDVTHAFSLVEYVPFPGQKEGPRRIFPCSMEYLEQVRKHALAKIQNKSNPGLPWNKWPEQMMRKTAIKAHSKQLGIGGAAAEALDIDTRADTDIGQRLAETMSARIQEAEAIDVRMDTDDAPTIAPLPEPVPAEVVVEEPEAAEEPEVVVEEAPESAEEVQRKAEEADDQAARAAFEKHLEEQAKPNTKGGRSTRKGK